MRRRDLMGYRRRHGVPSNFSICPGPHGPQWDANKTANTRVAKNGYLPPYKNNPMQAAKNRTVLQWPIPPFVKKNLTPPLPRSFNRTHKSTPTTCVN